MEVQNNKETRQTYGKYYAMPRLTKLDALWILYFGITASCVTIAISGRNRSDKENSIHEL